MTTTWTPAKTMAQGRKGMVAAQHRKAAAAAARVLEQGGNAMDAAIAGALVLSVVEPWLSGIGGGGFLVWRDGASGAVETLDFNMASGAATDPADYPLVEGVDGDWFDWPAVQDQRNLIGPLSVGVPGAIAGFAAGLARHGSIRFAEAIAPAIAEAEAGLEVDWFTNLCLSIDAGNLATDPTSAAMWLRGGKPPAIGTVLPLPQKAATLRRLAGAGWEDFYRGELARAMVADLQALGARLTLEDFAGYEPVWKAPLSFDYRGHRIHAMPGLSGGPAIRDVFARLDADPRMALCQCGPSAEHFAAYADAIRAAYAHRLNFVGHAGEHGIDPGCTSHISVVDQWGNAVSLTNTLLSRFGSKVTSASTGVLLNNAMMWFDPRPGTPNGIAPAVRPLANMCPLIVNTAAGSTLAIGAAGGRQIMPALAQLVSFRLDFGMDPGQALALPRIDASTPQIKVNAATPLATLGLIARNHDAVLVEDSLYPVLFAIPSAAERQADGLCLGMSHPNSPWAAAIAAGERA